MHSSLPVFSRGKLSRLDNMDRSARVSEPKTCLGISFGFIAQAKCMHNTGFAIPLTH